MNAMDAVRSMLLAVADEPLLGRLVLASIEMAVRGAPSVVTEETTRSKS